MNYVVYFKFPAPLTVGSALFWRIVDWCLREGATEFTFSVYGFDDAQAVQDRLAQIKQLLQPYELPPAKRNKPSGCLWKEDELIPLWMLTVESLEFLKRNRFLNAKAKTHKDVKVENFCLYRVGKPMFAIFKEQDPEVCVILRPDEVKLFQQDYPELIGAYNPQDLWGSGDQSFSSGTN